MPANRFTGFGEPTFRHPQEAIAAIERDGFNWRLVREYFRFTDDWLSEGEYNRLLGLALASIGDDEGRKILLDMLDLQYSVFLEQVALQEKMLKHTEDDRESVAFGERVMAYLQINSNHRPFSGGGRMSARSALFDIPPGTMVELLLGSQGSQDATQQDK